MTRTTRKNDKPVSSTKMLQFIIREVRLLQSELRHDIRALDNKLSNRIDGLASKIDEVKSELNEVKSDLKGLRIQTHQNHISFITNQQGMEKRITVLEAA